MKIKCILVMPHKEVQKVKIPASKKFIKAFIGNELLEIRVSKNTKILANQKPERDEFNRLFQGDILYGTFLVVSFKNKRLASMKRKDIRKFQNIFKLTKHEKKITKYKEEFLEEYYYKQRKIKETNRKHNGDFIFRNVA